MTTETIHPEDFRQSMRRWASGVTVVTAAFDGHMHGMTVSAFSSVSADPALVLVCANRASTTHGIIQQAHHFAVNILASDQQNVSGLFAASKETSPFEAIAWSKGAHGVPLIAGALAHLECTVASAYTEGSHTIYVGNVEKAHVVDADADKKPLVYYQGAYRVI